MKSVALFGGNSTLPLPECLESCQWQFLKVDVFDRKTIENHLQGELDLGRLQTSREQNGRVRLFEEYILNVAIPPKDEFSTKPRTTIDNMHLEDYYLSNNLVLVV